MNILDTVMEARSKLRSTQINWQEECLFDCDEILSAIIAELEPPQTVQPSHFEGLPSVNILDDGRVSVNWGAND